ncbi:MAG: L-cysteine desulfidase family protein [Promethearchaeota archaeon]
MDLIKFLKSNVVPATGCTEPVAVAYASAIAYNSLFSEAFSDEKPISQQFSTSTPPPDISHLVKLHIRTDKAVFKNAYAINVPGTNGQKGIKIAGAVGIFGNPSYELNILGNISENSLKQANEIRDLGLIKAQFIKENSEIPFLNIEITIEYTKKSPDQKYQKIFVRLQGSHTNIHLIKGWDFSNEEHTLFKGNDFSPIQIEDPVNLSEVFPTSLDILHTLADNADLNVLTEVKKGIELNYNIAIEGLSGNYGIGVGKAFKEFAKTMNSEDELFHKVKYYTAAAADARMGGCSLPVMTTSGSGNQGIVAILPIFFVAEKYNKTTDELCRAVLFSHLVDHSCALPIGLFSPLCGAAIKSGMGATAGIVYLMGGTLDQINNAMNMMAGGLTGMLCDGAKNGCALKVGNSSQAALESAFMVLNGYSISSQNGIIYSDAPDTMKNIGRISKAMKNIDSEILTIMENKKD